MKKLSIAIKIVMILHGNALIAMDKDHVKRQEEQKARLAEHANNLPRQQIHEKNLQIQHEMIAQKDADKYAWEALRLAKKNNTLVKPFPKNVNLFLSQPAMTEIKRYNASKK